MENEGASAIDRKAKWQAPARPEWLAALNAEGENHQHADRVRMLMVETMFSVSCSSRFLV